MKTTKHILIAVIGVIAAVSTACEEDNALHPWGENTLVGDLGAVTVLTTEGTPGGAVITYRLPESKDLLYVKALYTVGESTPMEVRTSRYEHCRVSVIRSRARLRFSVWTKWKMKVLP